MRAYDRGQADDEGLDLGQGGDHFDERIRLTRDLMQSVSTMGSAQARYLVDAYYNTQENRKRTDNQLRSLEVGSEPHQLIAWVTEKNWTLEQQIARALNAYTRDHPMGEWMRNIVGIGPVLSAGLLAHIYMGEWCAFCRAHNMADCEKRQASKRKVPKGREPIPPHQYTPERSCPTVGHIWQFAGIAGDNQRPWLEGQVRPFNGDFKVICWKVGHSFMMNSNRPNCFYGHIYKDRKAYEIKRNEAGELADQAAKALPRFRTTTEAYGYYKQGLLPPAHIDARARRYAVKLFLSHLHGEWHKRAFGTPPPLPYPIAFLGHAHLINPPNAAN